MLSRAGLKAHLLRSIKSSQRAFSSGIAIREEGLNTAIHESNKILAKSYITTKQMSDNNSKLIEEDARENAEYYAMLANTAERQRLFSNLARPDSNDHSEVAKVKKRINKLIQEEIALAGFEEQVSEEER